MLALPAASPRVVIDALRRRFKTNPKGTAVIAAACLALLRYVWRMYRLRPRNVPRPPGHWLFGNLPEILQALKENTHLDFIADQMMEFKVRTFLGKFPFSPWMVVTTDPRNVEHILKTNFENYDKGEWMCVKLLELLGHGIFNVDGPSWYMQRKTASKMFTQNLFKEHIWVVVNRNSKKLRSILTRSAKKADGGSRSAEPVNVFDLLNRFTLDTIGEIGFGKCIGALEDPSSPFLKAFDKAQSITFLRVFNPLWWPMRKLSALAERDSAMYFKLLDDYSVGVVRELRANLDSSCGKQGGVNWQDLEARKSFLGLFMEGAKKQGEELTEEQCRDLVLNFLIAGRDTTAQALSWTIFLLTQNPDVEAKARKEILSVCGANGPSYDDMGSLPYLNAVLHEALRLKPSVPLDTKIAVKDDVWPDGSVIPRTTMVVYNIYGMGRDEQLWGPDAREFKPERWLAMKEPPSNYAYPVFNAGPRECLGRRLAIVEMKACLAMLLPAMTFKLAKPADEVKADTMLTIGMYGGLPCYVELLESDENDVRSNASTAARSDSESAPCVDDEA
eukprot:TRINITY_DN74446_c0_g1_i1.p1 TRINITY_DN74446_c0_g1~~TRINITY_DN74446_c0_g1_i1.p1  ORF type:complete len:560 (+),score=132.88 TRINITY_DN74446_c0_g1_i1:68-1747(+)